jgi:hypothetical protein
MNEIDHPVFWTKLRARYIDVIQKAYDCQYEDAQRVADCSMSILGTGNDEMLIARLQTLQGMSIPDIARIRGRSRRQVQRWVLENGYHKVRSILGAILEW